MLQFMGSQRVRHDLRDWTTTPLRGFPGGSAVNDPPAHANETKLRKLTQI